MGNFGQAAMDRIAWYR